MTNDEIRMTNQAPNSNDPAVADAVFGLEFVVWDFIRHSDFVIRHSLFQV
ncbi:MAG: hypothetical protein WC058_04700 [Phycisphaeraceae bacterium]